MACMINYRGICPYNTLRRVLSGQNDLTINVRFKADLIFKLKDYKGWSFK